MQRHPHIADDSYEGKLHWLSDGVDIVRVTRWWIQYGVLGFSVLCIVIGAVKALFGLE